MNETKLTTVKPVLFVMMGLPGAGKTHTATFLAEKLRGFHIEADEFRQELFEEPDRSPNQDQVVNRISVLLLEKFMNKNINIILDANSNSKNARRQYTSLAKKYNYKTILVWVQTDIDTSYYRASSRDRRRADDRHSVQVDESTFERLMKELQAPLQHDDYVVVSGKHVFNTQLNSIIKKLDDLHLLPTVKKTQVFTPRKTQVVSTRQTKPRRRISFS